LTRLQAPRCLGRLADGRRSTAGAGSLPRLALAALIAAVAGLAVAFCAVGVRPAAAAAAATARVSASQLRLPSGATSAKGRQTAKLESVSCTGAGNCVAVGSYTDTHGRDDSQAMVATETNGVWGRARRTKLPSDANTAKGQQHATLSSVACTSPENCIAAGSYTDADGKNDHQAMVVAESGGVWGQASALTLPADANSIPGGQRAGLDAVSCTSQGNCTAVGYYEDSDAPKGGRVAPFYDVYYSQAMVVAETGGVWGQASKVTLPAGANASPGTQSANLMSVACTSPGNCVAVGQYLDNGLNGQAMVAAEASGAWGQASELSLPADAAPIATAGSGCPSVCGQDAALESVECTSQENCVAAGYYLDNSPSCNKYNQCTAFDEAMAATETSGVWGPAANVGGSRLSSLSSIACTGPGDCVAVGQQTNIKVNFEGTPIQTSYQAMVAADTGGTWGSVSKVVLPSGATKMAGYQDAKLDSVACTSPGSCVAVGQYVDATDSRQAMIVGPDSVLAASKATARRKAPSAPSRRADRAAGLRNRRSAR
jgi:hypothetical protein